MTALWTGPMFYYVNPLTGQPGHPHPAATGGLGATHHHPHPAAGGLYPTYPPPHPYLPPPTVSSNTDPTLPTEEAMDTSEQGGVGEEAAAQEGGGVEEAEEAEEKEAETDQVRKCTCF